MSASNAAPPNPLDHGETPEQAAEYLRLTLPLLARFGLPPNPVNFTLCYEYVTGRNQPLREAMDRVDRQAYSKDVCVNLYRRFVWDDDKRGLEDLRAEFRRIITETLSGVGHAHGEAAHSSEVLMACSQQIEGAADLSELRTVVAEVVSETKSIAHSGHVLKDMLEETNREVQNLREELQKTRLEATTDPLTGVLNRRAFDVALQTAINVDGRAADNLCLLIGDIDHFKQVNDNYGHLVGDRVIRFVAELLSANVKGKDTVARYGGEEFAVLLPGTQLRNAIKVAKTIRQLIEKGRVKRLNSSEDIGAITISMGVACYRPGEDTSEFVRRADEALYRSKGLGRNQVSVSP